MLTTQLSPIHRLRNDGDNEAWMAFVSIYYPVIVNSLRAVALELGKQVGSIYAARSRVIRRLRKEIETLERDP